MTPDTTEPMRADAVPGRRSRGAAWTALVVVGSLSALGAAAVMAGHRLARSAVIDAGPTDSHYARDFRDIERDGSSYFRWSSVPSSSFQIPLRFCGPGQIRLRVRRHFDDPALLSVSISGVVVGQQSVQARTDHPYEVIEFVVPKVACVSDASILLETSVGNDRPLGVAVDWVEIRANNGFQATFGTLARGSLLLALVGMALMVTGSRLPLALTVGGSTATLIGLAFALAPIAAERILRGGLVALTLTAILGMMIARAVRVHDLPARYRTALVVVTLLTLSFRCAFLHTRAFYPDYRVHALVQQTLNRIGLSAFLDRLFEIQYARSLGLQQIEGNWYPFPYPPGAYVLSDGIGRIFGLDPLDSAMITAASFSSLVPILTMAIGVSLGLGPLAGLAGALFVSVQPLLVRRMALGYFPGLAGQFVDAVAVLLLLSALRGPAVPLVSVSRLTGVLVAGFLMYTQSIANFGLLIATLLFLEIGPMRRGNWSGALRVAAAGTLALLVSVGTFYSRYLPVLDNIASHRQQPESRVLERLEEIRARQQSSGDPSNVDDRNDPYSGSTIDLARGLSRLGSRLWRFNGPFVLLIAIGAWLLLQQSDRTTRHVVLAWGAVAVWISLLAAGLPSPNGFQHLKDLEFAAPLVALAMGVGTTRLWQRHPRTAAVLLGAWIIFAAIAFVGEWTDRLLSLTDL